MGPSVASAWLANAFPRLNTGNVRVLFITRVPMADLFPPQGFMEPLIDKLL